MIHPKWSADRDDLRIVRGRAQVLALAPVLEELARKTGQPGAMHWLGYFLATRSRASKPPYLVLQLHRALPLGELGADAIRAAALFFEYRIAGIRTRIFSTDDAVGYRTVIADPNERDRFASRAVHALMDCGAHIVLANYESTGAEATPSPSQYKLLAGRRERTVPRMLALSQTYEKTLARFGHSTRFNLRYYRRKLDRRLPQLEFVDDVRPHINLAQFESLNAASLNPVRSAHEVKLRWQSACQLRDSFVVGLRSSQGKWLSLIAGWRQDATTVLHWQLNSSGYEQDSIGTVMRSFFLEHEIARGARELLIYGGTPHTIRHAFRQDPIVDLVLCRDSLRSRICCGLARLLSTSKLSFASNHLIHTLGELELQPTTFETVHGATLTSRV